MRRVQGPRPAGVRWFAVCFLLQAVATFVHDARDLARFATVLGGQLPGLSITRDTAIVVLSARLSIAAIPVLLIWFRASRIARWLATALALGKLFAMPRALAVAGSGAALSPWWLASVVLSLVAAGLLFTPAARGYFRGRRHATVFD